MKHERRHALLTSVFAVLVGVAGACSQKTESTGQDSASKANIKRAHIVYYAMPG